MFELPTATDKQFEKYQILQTLMEEQSWQLRYSGKERNVTKEKSKGARCVKYNKESLSLSLSFSFHLLHCDKTKRNKLRYARFGERRWTEQ